MTHPTHHPRHRAHREPEHTGQNAGTKFESGDLPGEPPLRKRRGFGRPHALVVIGTALSLIALAGFILIPYLYEAFG